MIKNSTKAKLKAGETVLGCFLKSRDASFAEFVALAGWDFLVFDAEHGPIQPADCESLVRAAELQGVTPLVRVTTNRPEIILRFMDTGAHGLHVPWVSTTEAAEQAVQSVKYHPRGKRGLAGTRASQWGLRPFGEYVENANRETLVVIHIETAEAVAAIGDYLQIDGIDVIFLGPTDLSQSLGVPGQADHPIVNDALHEVAAAVAGSDKVLGIFAGSAVFAREWHERGARYIATGLEGLLRPAMVAYLEAVRRDR